MAWLLVQVMETEKDIQIQKEMQLALHPDHGQAESAAFTKGVSRLRLRLSELHALQHRLQTEIANAIAKRETSVVKVGGRGREPVRNSVGASLAVIFSQFASAETSKLGPDHSTVTTAARTVCEMKCWLCQGRAMERLAEDRKGPSSVIYKKRQMLAALNTSLQVHAV